MSAKAQNSRLALEIEAIVTEAVTSRYLTHAYVEAGFLNEGAPRFVLSPKDGRDIFDLASLTKAVVTTPLAFAWLHSKRRDFAVTVGELFSPADRASLPRELHALTVRELLSHRSGLPAWRNLYVNRLGPTAKLKDLAATKETFLTDFFTRSSPWALSDKRDRYSDVGFILLGFVMERAHGQNLRTLFNALCARVGLEVTAANYLDFAVDTDIGARAVPTGFCPVRQRELVGEVYDENAAALGGVAAHAGLFGTGPALSGFLKKLAQTDLGKEIIAENSAITKTQVDGGLLGWRQGGDPAARVFGDGRAIGHLGFTGTAFWMDPARNTYAIVLTNRVISGRRSERIKALRQEILARLSEILSM